MDLTHATLVWGTALCWLTVDAYWLWSSRHTKRTVAIGQQPFVRRIYLSFLILGFALYYLPLSAVPVLGWRVFPKTGWIPGLGLATCVLGASFAIWARRVLGRNWSGAVTLKESHTLVTCGPFGIVRHPIYTGLLLAMVGTTVVVGELRAVLPLFNVLGICSKMAAEEDLLRQAFPMEYPAYASRVKRLVPWLI